MAQKSNIVVVGGGLSGLTASLLLARHGIHVTCLDRFSIEEQSKADERTTAISFGSSKIFEKAGIWNGLKPLGCPIDQIDILDGHSPKFLNFKKIETDAPMGWIFENRDLRQIMHQAIKETPALNYCPDQNCLSFESNNNKVIVQTDKGRQYETALLIGADGRQSSVRKAFGLECFHKDYCQTALVCIITHEFPHKNKAVEHFFTDGPFAVLPMNDTKDGDHRSAIVWSFHDTLTPAIDNSALIRAGLETRLPEQYGRILKIENMALYPLTLNHAYHYTAQRMALIADAAHGIHPIAGQGLNLGLQDIRCLSALLIKAQKNNRDFGSADLLKTYEAKRRLLNTQMTIATDSLNTLFASRSPAFQILRKVGMAGIARLSPAKNFLVKTAMGLKS